MGPMYYHKDDPNGDKYVSPMDRMRYEVIAIYKTRWWFQMFFYFHPYLGKISNLTNIFQVAETTT